MKTKKWVLVATGVVVTFALIVGAGLVNADWSRTSTASAESVDLNAAHIQVFDFDSENINQRLREFDALAEYQVFDFESENINQRIREFETVNAAEDQGVELAPENINQILREFEEVNDLQDQLELRKAHIELDYDPMQKEMRFNLPEGRN